jgi:hypothetical protein
LVEFSSGGCLFVVDLVLVCLMMSWLVGVEWLSGQEEEEEEREREKRREGGVLAGLLTKLKGKERRMK